MFELPSERPAHWDLPNEAANDYAVSKPQAGKSRRRKPDWTDGLTTRTANALRAYGLRSREELQALPERALQRIPNLGRVSQHELRQWLREVVMGRVGAG